MSYFYIASPYTHSDPAVRRARFEKAVDFGAHLAKKSVWTFGPIAHSHFMCIRQDMPYTFEFWDNWNRAMIYPSSGIILFQIDGWQESRGIAAELKYAEELGKPVLKSRELWPEFDHE